MAGLVRQECLACTRLTVPCCDGTGVRLLRDPDGQVVDVQLCPRWPATWDEPLAYWEALAKYDIDAIPLTTVPEKVWPAVQAAIAHTQRPTGQSEQPTYAEAAPSRAVGLVFAVLAVVLVALAALVVLS